LPFISLPLRIISWFPASVAGSSFLAGRRSGTSPAKAERLDFQFFQQEHGRELMRTNGPTQAVLRSIVPTLESRKVVHRSEIMGQ